MREHWQRVLDKKIKRVKQIVNYDLKLIQETKRRESKQYKPKDVEIDVIFTSEEKPKNIPDNEFYASHKDLGKFPIEIAIYKNNVIFLLSKKANRPAILIEDEDIAKGMEILYDIAKKYFKNTQ